MTGGDGGVTVPVIAIVLKEALGKEVGREGMIG